MEDFLPARVEYEEVDSARSRRVRPQPSYRPAALVTQRVGGRFRQPSTVVPGVVIGWLEHQMYGRSRCWVLWLFCRVPVSIFGSFYRGENFGLVRDGRDDRHA